MIINMERVSQLIREGDSEATLSVSLRVEDIVDERGRFRQVGPRIPLLDAIRGLVAASKRLFPGLVHPAEECGTSVDKRAWEDVIASLERVTAVESLVNEPTPTSIAKEVDSAEQAHTAAFEILQSVTEDPRFTMDAFVQLVQASPNRELTEQMIEAAGEVNAGWTLGDRVLEPLQTVMPATLRASKPLEIRGRIYDVDDVTGLASLEIDGYRDAYARSMLAHHTPRVPLRFDQDSAERDDLLVLQYHRHPVWIRATAVCAVTAKHSRKSALSLSKILLTRTALDKWHQTARQLSLQLDDVSD